MKVACSTLAPGTRVRVDDRASHFNGQVGTWDGTALRLSVSGEEVLFGDRTFVVPERVEVWGDGYGRWHASVLFSGRATEDAAVARRAIRAALKERDAIGTGYRLRVSREDVTTHGTAVYVEA